MRMKSGKKSSMVKRGEKKVKPPAIGALTYRGPTSLPKTLEANETEVAELLYIGSVATTAGGVINTVFDAYSQLTSSPDWSSYANLWQEYRILSMKVHAEPWNKYNQPTTSALAPVYSVVARDTATALSSLSDCAGYASVEIHAPSTPFDKEIKMAGAGEAQFVLTTASPATSDRLYIKLYSSGNVASTTVYDYLDRILVQFRGRK